MQYHLKTRQICLFFIAFLPVTKLFSLPSVIAGVANEDMWISSVINMLIDLITLSALIFTCSRAKTDFYGLLKLNFGKVVAKIILGFYFIAFIAKALIPLTEQKNFVDLTLYETLPNVLNFLPFFLISFYLCIKGVRVLGRCADILWVCTLIGVSLIFVLSIPNSDFSAALPVGANGFKNIMTGSYRSFNWYGDCLYLAFFIGQFKFQKKDGVKLTLSYVLPTVMVAIFMLIFYGVFTSIAHRQTFALTEISKYTTVINNIGRFDYIGILFILLSNFFALSLPIYFACDIIKKICGFKKAWIPALIVNVLLVLYMFIFNEYFASVEKFIQSYGNAFFFITANVLPIITVFLKKGDTPNATLKREINGFKKGDKNENNTF